MHLYLIAALLFFTAVGFSQPVVSNIRVDDVGVNGGHSSFRVTWDTDVAPDNQRIQWGPTSALGRTYYTYAPKYSKTNQQLLLSGLVEGPDMNSSRTVHFCVQSRNPAGWSGCTIQSVTLPPPPAVHPAPAVLPATFAIAEPSTAGCTVWNVASNMSDLQSKINSAVAQQPSACQVINLAPGTVGNVNVVVPPAADADRVPTANVNIGSKTITPNSPKNSYTNGLRVRVAGDGWNGDGLPSGLTEGADYCVVEKSGSAFRLALWPGCGSPVSLGSAGTRSWYIMPFPPPHSNYILIRSTEAGLPPEGVRADLQWRTNSSPKWHPASLGRQGLYSLQFRSFAHHFYIGPGINFTVPSSKQFDTTDPQPWPGWIMLPVSSSYIAIQRNWFNGGGYPERINRPMLPEGSYIDFSDNYQENIDYWRPVRTGLALSQTGKVVTIASGGFNTGIGECPAIASSTATLSGSTSGTAYVTIRPSDCRPILTVPAGTTVSCNKCATATGTDWPRNGSGRFAHGLVGTCAYSSGAWTGCAMKDEGEFSGDQYETWAGHIISYGPGPYRIANNYQASHGIFWHLDDSGSDKTLTIPSDVLFKRNVFATPDLYRYGSAGSNGLRYKNRNQWECKRCSRVALIGNEFFGNFADINTGPTILINANANFAPQPSISSASDFTMISNKIHHASGGIQLGGGPPGSNMVPQLGRKMTIKNNLLNEINGWEYYDRLSRNNTLGYCFMLSHGGEDLILDHNTCYSAAGSLAVAFVGVSKMIEGVQISNNFFYFHQDAGFNGISIDWGSFGTGKPNCGGLTGKAGLDCWFNGKYTFRGNVLISGYLNSKLKSGDSDASQLAAAYTGLSGNFFPLQSTVSGRLTSRRWLSPTSGNFRLGQNSPNVSGGNERGTDGRDVGVDQDALEDALGQIRNIRTASITSSGATVQFHAPDAGGGCFVGYGTASSPVLWSRTAANTVNSQQRSIVLSGLQRATTYKFQVWCAGTAPTRTQTLRTTG